MVIVLKMTTKLNALREPEIMCGCIITLHPTSGRRPDLCVLIEPDTEGDLSEEDLIFSLTTKVPRRNAPDLVSVPHARNVQASH